MQGESSGQQPPRQDDDPGNVPLVLFEAAVAWIYSCDLGRASTFYIANPRILAELPTRFMAAGVRVCGSIDGGPLQWIKLDDYRLRCVLVPSPPVDTHVRVEAVRGAQTICNLQVDREALLRAFPGLHGSPTIGEFSSAGTITVSPVDDAVANLTALIGPVTLAATTDLGSESVTLEDGQLFSGCLIDAAQADLQTSGFSLRPRKGAINHVIEFCKAQGVDLHPEKHRKTIMNHIILPVEHRRR